MKMAWFRFYHEALFDPKIQALPGDTYKAWNNILCIASMQKIRGILPSISDIAFFLHLTKETTQTVIDDLIVKGLLDITDQGLRPHNWDERQYDRTPNAERQKRYRDRHPNVTKRNTETTPTVTESVTSNVTRNAPSDAPVTQRITVDTETDTEKTPLVPQGGMPLGLKTTEIHDSDSDQDEPFSSQGSGLPSPALPRVVNDPSEVKRVAEKAERLFPSLSFGPKVHEVSGDIPMANMDFALETMHGMGKRNWLYLLGIIRRVAREGLPTPAGNATSAPRPGKPQSQTLSIYAPVQLSEANQKKYANPKKPTPLGEGAGIGTGKTTATGTGA